MSEISQVVLKYQQDMIEHMDTPPRAGNAIIDGKVTRQFMTYVTADVKRLHGFLRDCRIISASQECPKCGKTMQLKLYVT